MRKRIVWTLAISALAVAALSALAFARSRRQPPVIIKGGNLILKADGGVTPERLSRRRFTPISVHVSGALHTTDGSHPPAMRTTIIDFDRNGFVNARGIPVCRKGQLVARDTKAAERACGRAIVGRGMSLAEIEFEESAPFRVKGPLVLFNGGVRGRGAHQQTLLLIHTYLESPVATALTIPVLIKKIHAGRYGTRTIAQVPQISGGFGSTIYFNLRTNRLVKVGRHRRGYSYARCRDGHFNAAIRRADFYNEAHEGQKELAARLTGTVVRRCIPTR